ncbi:MAG: hypothetical protein KJ600_00040, partial [Nanoarchaeota archaeon]|nr:hypothetical protein [Nanoarchaeota archaeon]
FKGKNGTNIGSGSSGGNGGTINLTVRDLLNTTNGRFTGTGGYTTASGTSGGNGGTLQLNFHGLIRNFTSAGTGVAPTLSGGSSTDLVFGTGGTLIYNKDLATCPRDADVSGDGIINILDRAMIVLNYNKITDETGFTATRDISCDGKLNVIELAKIGFEWGTR